MTGKIFQKSIENSCIVKFEINDLKNKNEKIISIMTLKILNVCTHII